MIALSDMPMPLDAPQPDIDVAPFSGERIDMVEAGDEKDEEGRDRNRRRRGRRGGRRNRRERDENGNFIEVEGEERAETEATEVAADMAEARSDIFASEPAPSVRVIDIAAPALSEPAAAVAAPVAATAPEPAPLPAPAPVPEPVTTEPVVVGDPSKPKKGGWWARAKAGLTGQ